MESKVQTVLRQDIGIRSNSSCHGFGIFAHTPFTLEMPVQTEVLNKYPDKKVSFWVLQSIQHDTKQAFN